MKIGIAQTKSITGNVQENILQHLKVIDRALLLEADLIIFRELSLAGYKPDEAKNYRTFLEKISVYKSYFSVVESSANPTLIFTKQSRHGRKHFITFSI